MYWYVNVTLMSKPKTSLQQYEKTKSLLQEVKALASINWDNLFKVIDLEIPGMISCPSHLRQLANGHRYLTDANLAKLSKWAMLKNWGGNQARAALSFIPPTQEELDELERANRHDQYLEADKLERIINGPMRNAAQEKLRVSATLDSALTKLSPAGFSHADILYMVHCWLIKNPPSNMRGLRQRDIVTVDGADGRGLGWAVFPESLPNNFSMPDDRDGHPCLIECKISRPWADFEFRAPRKTGSLMRESVHRNND